MHGCLYTIILSGQVHIDNKLCVPYVTIIVKILIIVTYNMGHITYCQRGPEDIIIYTRIQ